MSGLDELTRLIPQAGPFLWVVIIGVFLSLFAVLGLAGALGFKMRVPLPLWLVGPLMVAVSGQAGMLLGQSMLKDALLWVGEGSHSMTWAGHGAALLPNIAGAYGTSLVLLCSVWAMGVLLALVPGDEPRWTVGLATVALLLPMVAGCATGGLAFTTSAWAAPVILVLGAPGLALACLRETETPRVHATRMGAAALLLLAVAWAVLGDVLRLERLLADIWQVSWLETVEVLDGLVTGTKQQISATLLGGAVNLLVGSALLLVMAIFGREGLDGRGALGAALALGFLMIPLLLEVGTRWVASGYLPTTW